MNVSKVFYGVFMTMMSQGMLNNQTLVVVGLKSVCHILKYSHGVSDLEINTGLKTFWTEFNAGCGNQMSESYIESTLIPTILNSPEVDLSLGTRLLGSAL